MSGFMDDYSAKIHEQLERIFQARKGAVLTTAEIKRLYKAQYDHPDVDWVQPSDHSTNMTNKGACFCAQTKRALFERIRRGVYRVR